MLLLFVVSRKDEYMKYKKPASLSSFIDTIGVSWRPKPETIFYNCRGYLPTKRAHDKVSTVPERRTNIGISRLQTQIPDPRPTYVSILREGSNYTSDGSRRYQTQTTISGISDTTDNTISEQTTRHQTGSRRQSASRRARDGVSDGSSREVAATTR